MIKLIENLIVSFDRYVYLRFILFIYKLISYTSYTIVVSLIYKGVRF